MDNLLKIPASNIKIGFVFFGALSFVILGVLILLDNEEMTSVMFKSEIINKIMAIAAIIFFGVIAITVPWKLFDNMICVIINEQGITDYSSLSSIGLIEWDDITSIKTERVKRTGFLLIYTENPDKYINKAKNKFKNV